MRLAGRRTALEELRAKGKLPIRHKWFKCNEDCAFDQTLAPIDAIPLDVGRAEMLEPLDRELSSRGFFDWRTWSMKRRLRPGTWRVRVVYRDNTPVLCPRGTPCEYWIDVN
jgi:hypothetical protein